MGTVVTMWRNRKAVPGEPGWEPRSTSIVVSPASCNRVVGSCRVEGASGAVYADAPAAWAAAVSMLQVYAVVGSVRAHIIADQVIAAGASQVVTWNNLLGGVDSLEIEITSPPVATSPHLILSVCTWDAGSGYWDARFEALVDRLREIELLLRHD